MRAALVLAALLSSPALAEGPPRPPLVEGYLALCENNAKACSDRLFDLIWERSVGEQKVGFCLPDDETTEQITAKAVAWLKARPLLASAPTDATLLKAMEAEYRCG
jgi:hypothetical protein